MGNGVGGEKRMEWLARVRCVCMCACSEFSLTPLSKTFLENVYCPNNLRSAPHPYPPLRTPSVGVGDGYATQMRRDGNRFDGGGGGGGAAASPNASSHVVNIPNYGAAATDFGKDSKG